MSKTTIITTRVDPALKQNAEHILAQLGITPAQAITMFLKQVELNRGLPFTPRLPPPLNKAPRKTFKVESVALGESTPERDELYSERGE